MTKQRLSASKKIERKEALGILRVTPGMLAKWVKAGFLKTDGYRRFDEQDVKELAKRVMIGSYRGNNKVHFILVDGIAYQWNDPRLVVELRKDKKR